MKFVCPTAGAPFWLLVCDLVFDFATAASYYGIPALLILAIRRNRPELGWIYVMFASFILACGTSHIAKQVARLWGPGFLPLEVAIDGVMAIVSAATLACLVVNRRRLQALLDEHASK